MTKLADVKPTVGNAAGSFEYLLDLAAIPASGDLTTIPSSGTGAFKNLPDINSLAPTNAPKKKDRTTYANKGQTKSTKRGSDFSMTVSILGIRDSTGEFQAALVLLLAAAEADGDANNVAYRYYHATSPSLAWLGTAGVEWTRANTGPDDDEWFDFTLTGQGDRAKITNPALASS
jgi:hypothetical protein